jgi:hypothetical protein
MTELVNKALRVFSRSLGIPTPSDLDAQYEANIGRYETVQEPLWSDSNGSYSSSDSSSSP